MKHRIMSAFLTIVIWGGVGNAQDWVDISPSFIPDTIWGLDGTFKNGSEGWVIGVGELPQKLYHTTDGGNTWEVQVARDSIFYSNMTFVNDDYGWMKVSSEIRPGLRYEHYLWRSKDGGKMWQRASTPSAFQTFFFFGSVLGFSSGETEFCRTADGGETWYKASINSEATFSVLDIFFIDSEHGWAVGGSGTFTDSGIILQTTDGGETWTVNRHPTGIDPYAICFSDRLHGLIAGGNAPFWVSTVYRTEDGGENWEVQSLPGEWLNDVVFTSDATAWMVGDQGYIWHTIDGGETWQQVPSGTENDLNRIVFVENGRVGYIFGEKNTLLKYEASTNMVQSQKEKKAGTFLLHRAYPNPFNGATRIEYELAESGIVYMRIFDLTGKEVVTLEDGWRPSGKHTVKWNGKDKFGQEVSSGVYVINLKTRNSSQARKICLIH